jgi:hypothetical protein
MMMAEKGRENKKAEGGDLASILQIKLQYNM